MSWEAPTANDVLSEFTPSEVASINTMMGGSATITNKLTQILSRTVAEIRGYIASGDYALDTKSEATLPLSMQVDAIAIARWRFLISAPQLNQLQTPERRDAMLESLKKLVAVAAQQFAPDPPVPPTETFIGGMWNSENKLIMRTHPVPKPATQFTPQTDTYANPDAPADATSTP